MPAMKDRLLHFLDGSPVEVESGGKPVSWSTRLITVLLAAGMFLGVFGCSLPDAGKEKPRSLAAEFQAKVNTFQDRGRIFIFERGDPARTASLASDVLPIAAQNGISAEKVMRTCATLLDFGKEKHSGFALSMQPEMPASHAVPVTVVFPNSPEWGLATAVAKIASCDQNTLCASLSIRMDQIDRFALYHEAFAHATEIGIIDNPLSPYGESIAELRADLAGLMGMARDEGNTRTGRFFAAMRDWGAFNEAQGYSIDHTPQQAAGLAGKYANGGYLLKAADKIDAILKDPRKAAAFRKADDATLLRMVDKMFREICPTQKKYAFNLDVLRISLLSTSSGTREAACKEMQANPKLRKAADALSLRLAGSAADIMDLKVFEKTEKPAQKTIHPPPSP